MSTRTKKSTFLREAVFGLVLSIVAAALATALGFLLPQADVARLVVAGLALAYLIHTFASSREKTGRIAIVVLWTVATLATWFWHPSVGVYVLAQVAMIWLVRSLYLYGHFVEALIDLALSALAISFGVWAALRTESLVLAIWSFFLIQALHVAVPRFAERWLKAEPPTTGNEPNNRGFSSALAAGEEALRRIAARQ